MASAFRDSHGWIADFRPLHSPGRKRRRVRIPPDRLPNDPASHALAARAIATECERLCRALEVMRPSRSMVDGALDIGAITREQAAALIGQEPVPYDQTPRRDEALRLIRAADMHPSTARQMKSAPHEYDREMKLLDRFIAWSGVKHVQDVTLEMVMRYIVRMRDDLGYSWDYRRRHLLFLRRATRMGASVGIPDPIGGLILDPRPRGHARAPTMAFDFERMARAVSDLRDAGELRAAAAIALGGLAGLRPSEMARAMPGDYANGLLRVGERLAKNESSRRTIPLPELARKVIEAAVKAHDPGVPILSPLQRIGKPADATLSLDNLWDWLGPILKRHVGPHSPKALRKTFATAAIRAGAPPHLVDEYLGHKIAMLSDVSARHYLEGARAKELRKVTVKIDAKIRESLQKKRLQIIDD